MNERLFIPKIFLTCFVFVILLSFPKSIVAANNYLMSSTANFNLRIDGQAWHDHIPDNAIRVADLDSDGTNDYIFGSIGSDYGGSHTGSIFIIKGSQLGDFGIGQTWDLLGSTKFYLRIDHTEVDSYYPYTLQTGDLNNDEKPDIIVGDPTGNAIIIFNDRLTGYAGVGNTNNVGSSSSYSIKYTGLFINAVSIGDFDGNNLADIAIGDYTNYTGNSAGSVYIIFNEKFNSLPSGTNVSLTDNINYDLRIDGAGNYDVFGDYVIENLGDLDNDGKDDLGIGSNGYGNGNGSDSGSLYIISGQILSSHKSTGDNIGIGVTSNFNIRIDGTNAYDLLTGWGYGHADAGDIDSDGKRDIIVGASMANTGGSIYLFCGNTLSDKLSSYGNIIETSIESNYNTRFYLTGSGDNLGDFIVNSTDMSGDGADDLILGASNGDRRGPGELFILNSVNGYCSQNGVNKNMSDSANYTYKFTGVSGSSLGYIPRVSLQDANFDGSPDLLVGAIYTGYNSRSESGSLYTILNFPHSFSIDAVSSNQLKSSSLTLTGSISASISTTKVSGIQYSKDSNNFSDIWTACTADDGTYDSKSEDFTCQLSDLSNGSHTIYVRAYDENTTYTPQVSYSATSFTINVAADPNSNSPKEDKPEPPRCKNPKPDNNPDLFQIDVNDTQATLFYAPVSGNVGDYYISYSEQPGTYQYGTSTGQGQSSGALSFTVNYLNPNTTYYFRVRGQNGCMPGDFGNEMKITTRSKGMSGNIIHYKNFPDPQTNSNQQSQPVNSSTQVLGVNKEENVQEVNNVVTSSPTQIPSSNSIIPSKPKKFCFLWWCF